MPVKSIKIPKEHVLPLTVGVLCLIVYAPALMWMWDRWFARDSYYSHGILIPFFTGYLIWQQKDELRKIPMQRSGWGMVLIVLGLLLYLLSAVLRVYFSSALSLLVVLVGIALHYYGTSILRRIVFPVSFLIFMVPLPMAVIVNISFKLKLFAATIAAKVLNNIGLVAIQQGSIIRMLHSQVVVDDVCSGLRSLISLMALGSVFAYWLQAPLYKKIILFLTTIPIAIVTNVCRVVILSAISEVWGSEYTVGFVHDATGFLVFALAVVMFVLVSRLIE